MYSTIPSIPILNSAASSGQGGTASFVGSGVISGGHGHHAAGGGSGAGGVGPQTMLTASVLSSFPPEAAHAVVTATVKSVSANLGIGHLINPGASSGPEGMIQGSTENESYNSQAASASMGPPPPPLKTEQQITWFMEVVCHGLSLPLAEHDTIKDCVNIYCEWLSALLPDKKPSVPSPIVEEPNRYSRKIISHLYHLFVPRKGEAQETIHKQAVLCHRVLRRIQDVVQQSEVIDRETWESVLCFLLAINDALLAPPAVKDDVGDQLCERVLGVLYEIWLLACVKCFPSPPLWKTFREMCARWRHRTGLVQQWNRVNLALTARLLGFMYGPDFPPLKLTTDDSTLVPAEMDNDCVAQSWYRFLHSLGNPVDLSRPAVISQTQHFYQYAIVAENVIDPTHHPCLAALPGIFLKASKGIAGMVDAFLGLPRSINLSRSTSTSAANVPSSSSVGPSSTASNSSLVGFSGISEKIVPADNRPKCNSILHLYGKWLFEAALIGTQFTLTSNPTSDSPEGSPPPPDPSKPPALPPRNNDKSAASSRKISPASGVTAGPTSTSLMSNSSLDLPAALTPDRFESGRAEAVGALCRIFCAKKTGEEILPVYLARFFLAVQEGLRSVTADKVVSDVVAMILVNSVDLLRCDLDGVHVLLPAIIEALEAVLPEQELKMRPTNVSKTDLRRAAIQLLISMLALPNHFQGLPIRDLTPFAKNEEKADFEERPRTFASLKTRVVNLIIKALQVENESINTQFLLGGLMFVVQDSTALETSESETSSSPDSPDDTAPALYVRATYLVCRRLVASWKSDLNASLAALELLGGIARVKHPEIDPMESKRAVKWICDYVVTQLSRPPPAHSRDLHSSIVAALRCLKIWLLNHPYLLKDKESISTVMEVVEQGISGQKSHQKQDEDPIAKDAKILNPASGRVKDAAESLLSCILEQVEYFPSSLGAESLSTLMDEASLSKQCANLAAGEGITMAEAVQNFRYFVFDNSLLMAILEEPLTNPNTIGEEDNSHPSVTIIMRTATSRSAWTMNLRMLPRSKSVNVRSGSGNARNNDPGRPLPLSETGVKSNVQPKFFPDNIDKIPLCKADKSIPPVENVPGDERAQTQLEQLSHLMDQQTQLEDQIVTAAVESEQHRNSSNDFECRPPEPISGFQTARLILSHLGLLNPANLRESIESPVPRLVALENDSSLFVQDIETLDKMSPRTADTVHVFYVKSGQKSIEGILQNSKSSAHVHPHFVEFLATLGWPVNVHKHPGWTGHFSTSWKPQTEPDSPMEDWQSPESGLGGGGEFNGDRHVLYWADAVSEIAFVVPTEKDNRGGLQFEERPRSVNEDKDMTDGLAASVPVAASRRRLNRTTSTLPWQDVKICVVWLERMEDSANLPFEGLIGQTLIGREAGAEKTNLPTEKEAFFIFIQPLTSGLLRVQMKGPTLKMNLATPLVDGLVASRRCVGGLVRQTALNIGHRRRLELDSAHPPLVRRKLKIQEIVHKYRSQMKESDFYAHLFQSNNV